MLNIDIMQHRTKLFSKLGYVYTYSIYTYCRSFELIMEDACPLCRFPSADCVCLEVPQGKFASDVKVVIIQDPAELKPTKRAVSSIPILTLLLASVEVLPCDPGTYKADIDLFARYGARSDEIALLYPSQASQPLTTLFPGRVADNNRHLAESSSTIGEPGYPFKILKVLLVLDGSWVTVQHILARNTYLHPTRCRHVRLPPSEVITASVYHTSGLRREPHKGFVSTAEAVAWALHFIQEEYHLVALKILQTFQMFVKFKIKSNSDSSREDIYDIYRESSSDSTLKRTSGASDESDVEGSVVKGVDVIELILLPSSGVRYKKPISKSTRRKIIREKESVKKRKR